MPNKVIKTEAEFLKLYPKFRERTIEGVELHGYSLPGMHLQYAKLFDVTFSGLYAARSLLNSMTATRVKFDGCDFSWSNFAHFDARNCIFDGVNLQGSAWNNGSDLTGNTFGNLTGACTFTGVGSRYDTLLVVLHGNVLMFKAGCFWGTQEEFQKKVLERHGRFSYHAHEYQACIRTAEKKLLK